MANPTLDKKLQILEGLLGSGQITQEMFDTNKRTIMNSLTDVPSNIESSGGFRQNLSKTQANPASTLSEVIPNLKQSGKVGNIGNEIKSAGNSPIGISPEIRNKGLFDKLTEKINLPKGVIDDVSPGGKIKNASLLESLIPPKTQGFASRLADDVSDVATKEGGMLKNLKSNAGFGKALPALGMAGAGLAALGIMNKVQAGEYGQAGLETADIATDYIPGVGQLKMAARPTELGNSELPEDEMLARKVYNEQVRRGKGESETINNPSNELPILAPENRVKYEDMTKFSNLINRMKK